MKNTKDAVYVWTQQQSLRQGIF